MCVSSWRTVTSCFPWAANPGRYRATGVSSPIRPRSTSCRAATEVNNFVTEAMSKTVSSRIGTRSSGGSSVPVPSA